MSELRIKIADLDGNEIGMLNQFSNLRCDLPWLDSRTGSVVIAMSDPWAKEIKPLSRVLKVYYGKVYHPVLVGIILRPVFNFAAGTIEISFHDPTILLKRHYHRFGDIVVDKGYPVDGRGLRRLVESSHPSVDQSNRGVKGNHIVWGADTTTPQASIANNGIWGKCIRGENVWDSIQKLAQKDIGPDFVFEPRDDLTATGAFVRLRTGAKYDDATGGTPLSTDYTAAGSALVSFIHGVNCEFEWSPDGNAVRNYYVAVNPGGEKNRATANLNRAKIHNEASWAEYGVYEGWESVGERVKLAVLKADAREWVKSYRQPPDYFAITPRQDAPNVPKLFEDFNVGDFVTAAGRREGIEKVVAGRVLNASIAQARTGSRQSILTLECAPVTTGTNVEGESA